MITIKNVNKKEVIYQICMWICAFCLAIDVNSVWASHYMAGGVIFYVLLGAVLCIMVVLNREHLIALQDKKYVLILLAGLFLYNLCTMVVRDGFSKWYIVKFVVLFPFFILYLFSTKNKKELLYAFSTIVYVLAIISLIFYSLGSILNIIPVTGNYYIEWGANTNAESYLHLHYNIQRLKIFGYTIWRNTGIYLEGPMYAVVLSLALTIELFLIKRERDRKFAIRISVLILTIFTTFSTTGFIVIAACAVALIFLEKQISKKVKYGLIGMVMLTVIIGFIMIIVRLTSNQSISVRLDDYRVIWDVLKDYPMLGVGFQNTTFIRDHYMSNRGWDYGGSNAFILGISQCGILFFLQYLLAFGLSVFCAIKNRKYDYLAFMIVIVVLFIANAITFKAIVIFLLASGIQYAYTNLKGKIRYGKSEIH